MIIRTILLPLLIIGQVSCEKLVTIDDPIDTITTNQIFSSEEQARSALAGIYTSMINDKNSAGNARDQFSAGLVTLLGGLSSDELNVYIGQNNSYFAFNANRVLRINGESTVLWTTAYTSIYAANSVVEGVGASTSSRLSENAKKKLTAEGKFIRAFCYFYLTNFFNDVPLALTVDFNKTRNLPKAPQEQVYRQIIDDLLAAQSGLPPVHLGKAGERIYPDKWAATALLARAYLYTGDYTNAWKQSNAVIENMGQFTLENDLEKVFLTGSKEAIWQLKQASDAPYGDIGNATPEGYLFIPASMPRAPLFYYISYPLSNQLISTFEAVDKRKTAWVGLSSANNPDVPGPHYFPHKYKTGSYNRVLGGVPTELYMMLRLAEQYLIRAEAAAHGAGNLMDGIADLNALRRRAGLSDLPNTLTQPQLLEAVAQERRIELFAEWGHRWLDLKRTGQASAVLRQLPVKQPWQGDYQLLYPIPPAEIQFDRFLIQNPGY